MWRAVAPLMAGTVAVAASLTPWASAHAAESGVETAVRVMAVDAVTGEATVIDAGSGEVVGRFTTPTGGFTYAYPSSTGRYLMLNHYEGEHVTIIDSGLSLTDHGDHSDLSTAPPFVQATVAVGPTPAHSWAHDGVLAVHTDGDGKVTLFDESSLEDGRVATTEFMVAQPDHTSIAMLGEAMLFGYNDVGRIDAYALDGELLQAGIIECPGAHGEAHFGEAIVFGCTDGLAFVTTDGETFEGQKIAYPAGEEGAHVSTLTAHEDNDVLVGNFGDGLARITADGGDVAIEILPLPSTPNAFRYDGDGDVVAVLTVDGAMHAIDPAAGEVLWTTAAVTPYAEVQIGDGYEFYPFIAATDSHVYVADGGTGEVLELDLASGDITNRFAIGGQPARVTLTQASGVAH
jgi:outer membrane protein assembly factor BamB